MRNISTILPLLLCACAPNINTKSVESVDDDRETTEETSDEGISEEGSSEENPQEDLEEGLEEEPAEEEPAEEEPTGEGSDFVLVSGVWNVTQATLVDDPCDWNTQLTMFFGLGSDALLPKDFTVEGFEGSFVIEANTYGASGPIFCTMNGVDFTCETQTVTPIDFDLGAMGWSYAIDFSGAVYDERSLDGNAVVSFPDIPEFLVSIFEAMGFDPAQCTQTYELSLANDL